MKCGIFVLLVAMAFVTQATGTWSLCVTSLGGLYTERIIFRILLYHVYSLFTVAKFKRRLFD